MKGRVIFYALKIQILLPYHCLSGLFPQTVRFGVLRRGWMGGTRLQAGTCGARVGGTRFRAGSPQFCGQCGGVWAAHSRAGPVARAGWELGGSQSRGRKVKCGRCAHWGARGSELVKRFVGRWWDGTAWRGPVRAWGPEPAVEWAACGFEFMLPCLKRWRS